MAFIYYLKYTTAGIHVSNTTLACFALYFLVGLALRATLSLSLSFSQLSLYFVPSHRTWRMQVRYPGQRPKTYTAEAAAMYIYIYILKRGYSFWLNAA